MVPVLSYWNDMRRFARFVPCAQFKKREKHSHEGVLGLVKWQAEAKTLLHRYFSRCLNCTNCKKSRKASHIMV